ncbi:tryptophan synthase subunit alpha [Uliginosibacterium sp. 31-16]|uniref:tryptophan synthase subunit alpha n=1 Tax=Uliginosibacterium sp. 31-16 TaxID=3068315 RepID=UPI00273D6311|nr:tryptophan synthase subunit alpha [Uliginosibacterium sp. 31-16]MDP5239794.1 tryptophan synthase subunit alpha [Uliginosibacterium sp. 31-16]
MSRIQNAFSRLKAEGRQALIPYITAGDPTPAATVGLMHALVQGGADIIELGVPFTDPSADGPVIQRAAERALAHGTSLRKVIAMVAEFRQTNVETPVVLMGYANPVEAMGYEAFAAAAQAAGIDGLLTVDLPPEEASERVAVLKRFGIAPIFLLAPTTPASRAQAVAKLADGYVYYVSLKGVTGAANLDVANVAAKLTELRQHIQLPIGVGFGIRDAESARAVAAVADAVVIGSRIVQEVENGETGLAERLTNFLSGVRAAMDTARA